MYLVCVWKSLSHVRLVATTLYSPWNFLGQNTGVGSLSFLQGIFPIQGSNSSLLHCGQILHQLSHKGSRRIPEWVAYPDSSGSSWLSNWTGVSFISGGFFTNWAIREVLNVYIGFSTIRGFDNHGDFGMYALRIRGNSCKLSIVADYQRASRKLF